MKQHTFISHLSGGRKPKTSLAGLKSGCQQAGSGENLFFAFSAPVGACLPPLNPFLKRGPPPVSMVTAATSPDPPDPLLEDSATAQGPPRCPGRSSRLGIFNSVTSAKCLCWGGTTFTASGVGTHIFGGPLSSLSHLARGRQPHAVGRAVIIKRRPSYSGGCSLTFLPRAEREQPEPRTCQERVCGPPVGSLLLILEPGVFRCRQECHSAALDTGS